MPASSRANEDLIRPPEHLKGRTRCQVQYAFREALPEKNPFPSIEKSFSNELTHGFLLFAVFPAR
jgi:hypothetical protein